MRILVTEMTIGAHHAQFDSEKLQFFAKNKLCYYHILQLEYLNKQAVKKLWKSDDYLF